MPRISLCSSVCVLKTIFLTQFPFAKKFCKLCVLNKLCFIPRSCFMHYVRLLKHFILGLCEVYCRYYEVKSTKIKYSQKLLCRSSVPKLIEIRKVLIHALNV